MGIMKERHKKAENKTAEKVKQTIQANQLKAQGYSVVDAAKLMGIPESAYRKLVK